MYYFVEEVKVSKVWVLGNYACWLYRCFHETALLRSNSSGSNELDLGHWWRRKSASSAGKATPKQSAKEEGGLMMEDHASTFTSLPNRFLFFTTSQWHQHFLSRSPPTFRCPEEERKRMAVLGQLPPYNKKRRFNEAPSSTQLTIWAKEEPVLKLDLVWSCLKEV